MQLDRGMRLEQKMGISTYLQQSLKILTMANQELVEFIEEACLDNPVLETEDRKEEITDFKDKINYLEDTKDLVYNGMSEVATESNLNLPENRGNTLESYLLEQVNAVLFPKNEIEYLHLLIKMIDKNGYITETSEELAALLRVNVQIVDKLISYIKEMDPLGVGARDFKECIKIQLQTYGQLSDEIELLIDEYLELLAKGNFAKVARMTHMSSSSVKEYYSLIKILNPVPGNGFGNKQAQYITPDIKVDFIGNTYQVTLEDKYLPRLHISSYWSNMLKAIKENKEDPDVEAYLNKKFEQAVKLMRTLESRKSTLTKVCNSIVEKQLIFLKTGKKKDLAPMRLKDIASEVDMHESTVSRSVQNKYLLCPWGVISLRELFVTAPVKMQLGGGHYEDEMGKGAIKEMIQQVVLQEDQSKPLSDTRISKDLEARGIRISRRTVVKYREELNIPNSFQRGKV